MRRLIARPDVRRILFPRWPCWCCRPSSTSPSACEGHRGALHHHGAGTDADVSALGTEYYAFVEALFLLALCYWGLVETAAGLGRLAERRLARFRFT